jgi:FdhD protein
MHPALEINITKVNGQIAETAVDMVATEEPLEIRLNYNTASGRTTKSISVTMRTPGNDEELATGFLYTEGIIQSAGEVMEIKKTGKKSEHVIYVSLQESIVPDVSKLERNFYTTSSCGVCGKSSIEAVRVACNILDTKDQIKLPPALLYSLPDILRKHQDVFEDTGGIHACAMFDLSGKLLIVREDAGRHNALDKLIGAALNTSLIPLNNHILLLSGRASFELIQKAAMAGIKIIASVGAPSSLAVQMADEWGMTLIGFLRANRFNIYTGAQRIKIAGGTA